MNLDDLLKVNNVRCIKTKVQEDLVEGEIYKVEGFNDETIKIVDRNGFSSWHNKNLFEPVDQKALEPTVYRLDCFDGEYYWHLVYSYDRAELEKLIADATEYHKTIKDLDFDDDEAVDVWLEKHPLNDFNGDRFNDLLDIDDYEPLSEYLSIYSFEVRGVSE